MSADIDVLRKQAEIYRKLSEEKRNAEKRALWKVHLSKERTGVPVIFTWGMWNAWANEEFADHKMECKDPVFRDFERIFKMKSFHAETGDDYIFEPWITAGAVHTNGRIDIWGLDQKLEYPKEKGGAAHIISPIKDWDDMKKLRMPRHEIDEKATAEKAGKLRKAFGDILEVDVLRKPVLTSFWGDLSTTLARLRGLEQIMIDMYDAPEKLKELLAFMRDGVLSNNEEAEKAGDYSLTSHDNQCMIYCNELEDPRPNVFGRKRSELWGYFASQEYTLISPEMHEEFLLNYQLPIIEKYGLSAYGCCEDLSNKIKMLRKIKNLRIIAVTPVANVQKCAEQIGTDYVISWRPNPTDMVCGEFNEAKIRRILKDGIEALKGTHFHIHLKDVENVENDPTRIKRWVRIVREELGKAGY